MSKYVPLAPKHFNNASWKPFTDFRHAKSREIIEVTVPEAVSLSRYLPLLIVKAPNHTAKICALMGTAPNTNICVNQDNQWILPFSPALFRTEPFRLMAQAGQPDKLVICVDSESPWVSLDNEHPNAFFSEENKLGEETEKVIEFLKSLEAQRLKSSAAAEALFAAGVLTEIKGLNISQTGFYKIDEEKLNNLDDRDLLKLRRKGAVFLAYLMLFSSQNMDRLTSKKAENESMIEDDSIDGLFNMKDDSIKFTF